MVAEAILNSQWIDNMKKPLNVQGFLQVLHIWEELQNFHLTPAAEDVWSCSWESNGVYSAKSVYRAHFRDLVVVSDYVAVTHASRFCSIAEPDASSPSSLLLLSCLLLPLPWCDNRVD